MRMRFQLESVALLVGLGAPCWAQATTRVNVASDGSLGNHGSDGSDSLSADGRYVVFLSWATNLVAGDTNGVVDVYLRDRFYGITERVSLGTGGVQANDESGGSFAMSPDARYVVFESLATNLVPGDTNGFTDIYLRDRLAGTTERVSIATGGIQGNDDSERPAVSSDGRYIVFDSNATNLVAGDSNGTWDVFVRDRQTRTTEHISLASDGTQGNDISANPKISADGRYVTFYSWATNLVPGDTNGALDVFVRDRQRGRTERVSVDSTGNQGDNMSGATTISADGRYVAFESWANNLIPNDTNGFYDIFVHDRLTGTTECVSVDSSEVQRYGDNFVGEISPDGRYVTFTSSSGFVPGDNNGYLDCYVRDRQLGTTERVSLSSFGAQPNKDSWGGGISTDGHYVDFGSSATNLFGGDTILGPDVYARERDDATHFTSLCDPGQQGVIACPCANPPLGAGRGCDNSSGTGGATLSASGIAYLSQDYLIFTTSDERPNALSILLQGTTSLAAGAPFGQGVRCVAGTLKRMYVKTSSASGSITAPNFEAQGSSRSAQLGDTIQPGQSRSYMVYYRDPILLGGCPAASTFNSTQTGRVVWLP